MRSTYLNKRPTALRTLPIFFSFFDEAAGPAGPRGPKVMVGSSPSSPSVSVTRAELARLLVREEDVSRAGDGERSEKNERTLRDRLCRPRRPFSAGEGSAVELARLLKVEAESERWCRFVNGRAETVEGGRGFPGFPPR